LDNVLSGILQGSVLGSLLFIIYINYLVDSCCDDVSIYLFADDAKLYAHIKFEQDELMLEKNTDNLAYWTDKWLMKLNTSKCKVMLLIIVDIQVVQCQLNI